MNHMFSEEQISALVQNIPKYVYIKIALTNRIKSGATRTTFSMVLLRRRDFRGSMLSKTLPTNIL